ncbi:MAG TPA: DUF2480 family protein [Chitinophagaceae bacterium]|nr:DUF2480 family protein [Chitinophagaceae bacterium]HUM64667.1 DUF2480 family protein [Chitinophagaceae bacterium]
MSEPIINKVAESGIITIDPASFVPTGETVVFDLKDYLFMGLILKEKDFRESLKALDWEQYRDKNVALLCSADAIVPAWAYMLVASNLQPVARDFGMGDESELQKQLFLKNIAKLDIRTFEDKRVVIKGCGDIPIGDFVYMELTRLLRPVVKSIMYGEPCSTVPVYKKPMQK